MARLTFEIDRKRVPYRRPAQRHSEKDGSPRWELLVSRIILLSSGDHDSLAKDLDSCGTVWELAVDR